MSTKHQAYLDELATKRLPAFQSGGQFKGSMWTGEVQ